MASRAQNSVTVVKPGLNYKANIRPYFKAAAKSPAWLIMVVFGRFNWVRALARRRHKLTDHPSKPIAASSVFRGIGIDQAVDHLVDKGCTPCFNLRDDRLLAIRQFLDTKLCHDGADPPIAFHINGR